MSSANPNDYLAEVYSDFKVVGIDPDVVTREIGLDPTRAWRKGDRNERGVHAGATVWILSSRLPPSSNLEEQLAEMMAVLSPRRQQLIQLRPRAEAFEFSFAIYLLTDHAPAVHFPSEFLRFTADIEAEIDVDLYPLSVERT